MRFLYRLLVCGVVMGAMPALAADMKGLLKGDSSQPLNIISDTLSADDNASVATFAGNVLASQGSFNLRGAQIRVYYDRNAKNPSGGEAASIQKVEASGKVVITTPDAAASANTATYYPNTGQLTMAGNVVLTQGKRVIKGGNLTADTNKGTVRIDGAGQRVRTLLPAAKAQ